MKESELRKHATCTLCRKPIGHTGVPLFWRVTVERFGVDLNAMRRQDGLAAMLNSPRLAMVMGADEEIAKPMMEPITVTVCESCAMESHPIAILPEWEAA
jgi:hypothetical protein